MKHKVKMLVETQKKGLLGRKTVREYKTVMPASRLWNIKIPFLMLSYTLISFLSVLTIRFLNINQFINPFQFFCKIIF